MIPSHAAGTAPSPGKSHNAANGGNDADFCDADPAGADGLQSPTAVEDLEHRVMDHVRIACPTAHWIGSHAICGPWDYLDLFRVENLDEASKISALVRSYGHAHTELWPLTEWSHFKTIIHELGLIRS